MGSRTEWAIAISVAMGKCPCFVGVLLSRLEELEYRNRQQSV